MLREITFGIGSFARILHMPELRVHLLLAPSPRVHAHLEEHLLPGIRPTMGSELPPDPAFEILVGGRVTEAQITASRDLHTLIIPWAGLQSSLRDLLRRYPHLSVHNLHHNASPAAELGIALLMAAAKSIVPMDRALRGNNWSLRYEGDSSLLLAGKHAVVLGYGAIGNQVGRLCRAIGMKVTGIRRRAERTDPQCPDVVTGVNSLHELLPSADALFLCLPLTPRTEGIIGCDELSLLPKSAILVNIGRGPLVDEESLYQALRSRSIHAAGVDVWYAYPPSAERRRHTPPSRFPFGELDNVVMSPHRAGHLAGEEAEMLRVRALAESLNAAARGEEIPHRVDVEEGY
jgi:phosphoglycerate dehydrogenase-like enzyme